MWLRGGGGGGGGRILGIASVAKYVCVEKVKNNYARYICGSCSCIQITTVAQGP